MKHRQVDSIHGRERELRNICSVNRYDVISGVDRNGEGDDHDHDVGNGDYDAAPTE